MINEYLAMGTDIPPPHFFSGKLESSRITLDETIELAKLMDTMRRAVGLQFPEDLS